MKYVKDCLLLWMTSTHGSFKAFRKRYVSTLEHARIIAYEFGPNEAPNLVEGWRPERRGFAICTFHIHLKPKENERTQIEPLSHVTRNCSMGDIPDAVAGWSMNYAIALSTSQDMQSEVSLRVPDSKKTKTTLSRLRRRRPS